MTEQTEIQIFLSYAIPDQDRVLEIYDFLIKNGFPNTWIDCKKLLPGQPWEYEILRNLKKSQIVLFFLSNNSVSKRGFVQKELKIALRYLEEKLSSDTYIIPLKLDLGVTVPDELSKIQYLDINHPSALKLLKQSIEEQVQKLGFDVIDSQGESTDLLHISKKIYKESWDGLPGYEVEFSVPIFHSTEFENISEVTKLIEASYIARLHTYRYQKLEQMPEVFSWTQNVFRRTNSFEAHYEAIYFENFFLSIYYRIYWYGGGAAHPNHHFETFNFILNPLIQLGDLKSILTDVSEESFDLIVTHVRRVLLDITMEGDGNEEEGEVEKLLSESWIIEGTKEWDSLSIFSFSEQGIIFHFSPYQVGPYSAGSHHITVPYRIIHRILSVDIKHALNISYLYD